MKTITVKAGNVQTAALVPLVAPAPQATVAPPHFAPNAVAVAPLAPPPARVRACSACCRPKRRRRSPPPVAYQTASATSRAGHDRVRRAAPAASARPLDHPGRRVSRRRPRRKDRLREAQSLAEEPARQGRSVHREGRQGQPGALPRPLRRLRPACRRSRLQVLQAQRNRLHGDQELARAAIAEALEARSARPGSCIRSETRSTSATGFPLAKRQSVPATVRSRKGRHRVATASAVRSR